MSWAIGIGYAGALLLAWTGWRARDDPLVGRLLGERDRDSIPPLVRLGRRLPLRRARARLRARGVADVDETLGRKAVLASIGAAVGLTVGGLQAPPVAAALAAGGSVLPDVLAARAADARRRRSVAAVPDLVDLVALGVTAGLSPRAALDRAASTAPSPLREELRRVRDHVDLGGAWPAALAELADRLHGPDLRRLAATLERSSRLGAPVLRSLVGFARDVRARDLARREERARRAPVLMLFPLVFCILPAFVVAAIVPAVLVATRGMG